VVRSFGSEIIFFVVRTVAHSVVREQTSSGGLGRSSSAGSSTTGSLVGAESLSGANSSSATDVLRLVVLYSIPNLQRRM
jgi:hypothetical protein